MILFLDLDGTVIGSNGVSDAVWSSIARARIRGAQLAVCTGRPRGGVSQRIAQHMSPTGPHIFESGGMVAPATGDPLYTAPMHPGDLERLILHSESTPAVLELYTPNGVFVSTYNADCQEHERVLEIKVHEADLRQIANVETVVRAHWIMRPETVDQVLSLELPHSHKAVASSPVLPENVFCSVTAEGDDKGSAARWVADLLGIQVVDTWAVGDSIGDLPILQVVGTGLVMAEAPEALRQQFQVLPSVNEDGVISAIDAFVDRFHPA